MPNESRLSCGRRARRRKGPAHPAVARPGEATADSLKSRPDSFKRMLGSMLVSLQDFLEACDGDSLALLHR